MKVAIMQPYFFPYIGYFQMMNAVDTFVVYDNIEFTKKGWINRNRILVNGKDEYISLSIKKDSDYLSIIERYLADTWQTDRKKLVNKITEAYRKSPFFKDAFPLIESCILHNETNLFKFILNSLLQTKEYLNIKTSIIISSTIEIDHSLKSEKKVIEICKSLNSNNYINPIGGVDLYNKNEFKDKDIDLQFIKATDIKYQQYNNEFVPWLSIIDVMMFNSKEKIKDYLDSYYTLQ